MSNAVLERGPVDYSGLQEDYPEWQPAPKSVNFDRIVALHGRQPRRGIFDAARRFVATTVDRVFPPASIPRVEQSNRKASWLTWLAPLALVGGVAVTTAKAHNQISQANYEECGDWPVQFGQQPVVAADTPELREQFGQDLDSALEQVSQVRGDVTPLANTNPDDALCWIEGADGIQVGLAPEYSTTLMELHGREGQEFGMELVPEPDAGGSYFAPTT